MLPTVVKSAVRDGEGYQRARQAFGLLLKEHRLGADLNDALRHLAERVDSPDSRIFSNSVVILRETGGNLTEIFDTLAATMNTLKLPLDFPD